MVLENFVILTKNPDYVPEVEAPKKKAIWFPKTIYIYIKTKVQYLCLDLSLISFNVLFKDPDVLHSFSPNEFISILMIDYTIQKLSIILLNLYTWSR